jgi:hypothetical protein
MGIDDNFDVGNGSGIAKPRPSDGAAVKFVLFFLTRSGSHMLKEWLSGHDAVRCLLSIFGKDSGWPKPGIYQNRYRWVRDNISPEWDDLELRRTKPLKLLREISACSLDKSVVGFKHQLDREPITDRLLGIGKELRKILLVRDNLLASYSSDKVTDVTGQGTARLGTTVIRAKVLFDPDEFRAFAGKRKNFYARARELMRKPCMEIDYTLARTPEGIEKVGRFLDVDPSGFGSPKTLKRNSDDIVSRFSNPELVRDYLRENALERWEVES